MNPIATAVAGAVISGVAMYTVGANTARVDAFTPAQAPELVQTTDQHFVPVTYAPAAARSVPAVTPVRTSRPVAARRQTVSRTAPVREREVVRDEDLRSDRSWGKTAMIVGGSAASGAGIGGIVGGKKGALIGAAIGGGAGSIYEATQRR